MPIQFLCPTCHKHYTLAEQFAGATVQCEACHQLMSVPAAQPAMAATSALGPSAGGALAGPPLLPPARKSTGIPKAAWIGIVATALIGVIVAIVVVLLNTKDSDAEKRIAGNMEGARPVATPSNSPNNSPNISSETPSTKNSTTPTARTNRATPANPATPPAPNAKTDQSVSNPPLGIAKDTASAAVGNTTSPRQAVNSAAPSNRWLKPFAPKNDDDSADATRKAKPSVNATPNVWNVKPDPAPQQITSGEIKWSEVEVPVLDRGHGMVHPLRPSPFVAIYGEDRGKRHVGTIDLRDGKKKGPFAIEARGRELPKLSFNGKLLAWLQIGDAAIQIHSLDDGKPGRRITLGGKADFRWYDFTDGAHLITYTTEFGNKEPRLELWSVASGESVRNFELPADAEGQNPEAATVSPGGSYVALGMKSALYIYEVASGNLVGELRLPPLSEHDQEARHASFQGLAFSWDGAELAAMVYSFGRSHFVVWSTDGGKVAANVQASQRLPAHGRNAGPRLEWLQSDGLLVDGKHLFHRDALRQPVEELKARTDFRRMLSWDRAVAIDSGKRARGMALVSMKLPGDELVKRAATLKLGGELAETGLPALKVAEFSGLMQVDLSTKPDGWGVQVQPVETASDLTSQISLSLGRGDDIKKTLITSTHALVLWQSNEGGVKRSLDRYDLHTGKQDATMAVYRDCNLVDVSHNGKLALLRTGNERPRLDIINLDERKHIVGWKPYADFPGEKSGNWNLDRAVFVDHEHVITMRKMNELVVWKVPECKALLIVTDAWNVQLSDDGRFFVTRAPNESAWAIHETLTGKPCGRIPFGLDLDLIEDVAFDPQGKRLAILRHHASYSRVALVDLATGQLAGELALPPPARRQQSGVYWAGREHLLIDQHLLADVARGGYILNYSFDGELIAGPAGVMWIASGPRRDTLLRPDLPSGKAESHAAQAQIPKPSLTKGGRISLSGTINVPGVNQDAFLKLIYDNLTKSGFVVDAQAPIRLHVEANEQGTGQTMQLRTFARVQGKTEFAIAGLEIPVKAVLSMPGGAQYTVYQTKHSNQSMFVRLKEDQNPEQFLQDEMRESFTRSANGITAPLFAFDAPAEANAPRVVWQNGQEQLLPPALPEVQAVVQ